MARSIEDIRTQYAALIEREERVGAKLTDTRTKLGTAREVDIAAAADAALEGGKAPKRTELTLRHAEENLGVELDGLDEAVYRLQLEARAAVGEGRDFPIFVPPDAPADRAEVIERMRDVSPRAEDESEEQYVVRLERQIPRSAGDAESIVREAKRQRELSLDRRMPRLTERPADLIAWVEAAYDAEDEKARDGYERKAAKQRRHDAVEAVQRAKAEHNRRGLPAGSFSMHNYPTIVLPEHLAEFGAPVERSPFQKVREQLPSFEEAQNEPVAEPQPVEEETPAEFRRREIEGRPPGDTRPITPERAAQIREGEEVADRLVEGKPPRPDREPVMSPIDVPGGSYPDQDRRRSTPGTRKLSGIVRGLKQRRDEQTEARQERFFRQPEPPEDEVIRAAREAAEAARAAADEAARRIG